MKGIINLVTAFTLLYCTACGQGQISKSAGQGVKQPETFKHKEKFIKEDRPPYPGIGDPAIKPILTGKINQSADNFKALLTGGTTTAGAYQDTIKKGLDRFAAIYVLPDTEDRERICAYYEELMNIVGLESSGGHLYNFRYGFDPGNE